MHQKGKKAIMVSLQFQERFKGRVGVIGKLGEVDWASDRPAHHPLATMPQLRTKPQAFMPVPPVFREHGDDAAVFVRPIRISASFISDTESSPPGCQLTDFESVRIQPKHKAIQSADYRGGQPVRAEKREERKKEMFTGQRREVEFSPYTLEDYRRKKLSRYYVLGGLGPFMIGSEEWKKRSELQRRRVQYGEQVMKSKGLGVWRNRREASSSPARVERRQL